jgi:hypothetical protein
MNGRKKQPKVINLTERIQIFTAGYKTGRKVWMYFSVIALCLGFQLGIVFWGFFHGK